MTNLTPGGPESEQPKRIPVTVTVTIFPQALRDLENKVSHVEIERLRQLVAEKAYNGEQPAPGIPFWQISLDDEELSKSVTVQYLTEPKSDGSYRIFIVAINPEEGLAQTSSEEITSRASLDWETFRKLSGEALRQLGAQAVKLTSHDFIIWLLTKMINW